MASLLNLSSGRIMGGKSLPYDAEIEYLRSTGTQYINSEVILQRADLCRINIICTSHVSGVWNVNGLSGYAFNGPAVGINNSNMFSYAAGTIDNSTGVNASMNVPYYYNLDIKNSTYIIKDYLNETEVYYNDNITKRSTAPKTHPMLIFGYYSGEPVLRAMTIYKAAIYENDVLLRDYIPVRVGQVGYMYDKVSGQLFGNAGTGDFILGADKQ